MRCEQSRYLLPIYAQKETHVSDLQQLYVRFVWNSFSKNSFFLNWFSKYRSTTFELMPNKYILNEITVFQNVIC